MEKKEFLSAIFEEPLENARRYLEDARILNEHKSFGHALALAVLGQEEVAKSLSFILIGLLYQAGKKEKAEQWLKELHRDHAKKLQLAQLTTLLRTELEKGKQKIEPALPKLKKKYLVGSRIEEVVVEALDQVLPEPSKKLQENEDRARKESNRLQSIKKSGLYVDLNLDSLKMTSPTEISEKEALREIEKLEKMIADAEKVGCEIFQHPSPVLVKVVRLLSSLI